MFKKMCESYSIFFLWFLLSAGAALGSEEVPRGQMPDRQQAEQFMSAALDGNLCAMRSILAACSGEVRVKLVNVNDELIGSPLHAAVQNRCLKSVHFLIERGARVQVTNNCEETALHDVAGNGDAALARLLIQSGADVQAEDASHYTPLHRAAESRHFKVAQLLVVNGADVNCETVSGETPLYLLLEDFKPNSSSNEIQNCLNIAILFVLHGAKLCDETVNKFTRFFPGHADWFRFVFAWQLSSDLCELPRDVRNLLRQFVTTIQRAEILR